MLISEEVESLAKLRHTYPCGVETAPLTKICISTAAADLHAAVHSLHISGGSRREHASLTMLVTQPTDSSRLTQTLVRDLATIH
jgi:hypothetical protein